MPLFTVDIEKLLGSEYWTNRYIVRTVDLNNAIPQAQDIVDAERIIHSSLVTFTKMRVASIVENDNLYTIVTLAVNGLAGTSNLLPLFNTYRYDFVASQGRPSRKYYRGVLDESHIQGDLVTLTTPEFEAAMEALFAIGAEGNGVIDPQEHNLVNAVRYNFVQMRQLRRGRRKRTTPVFQ